MLCRTSLATGYFFTDDSASNYGHILRTSTANAGLLEMPARGGGGGGRAAFQVGQAGKGSAFPAGRGVGGGGQGGQQPRPQQPRHHLQDQGTIIIIRAVRNQATSTTKTEKNKITKTQKWCVAVKVVRPSGACVPVLDATRLFCVCYCMIVFIKNVLDATQNHDQPRPEQKKGQRKGLRADHTPMERGRRRTQDWGTAAATTMNAHTTKLLPSCCIDCREHVCPVRLARTYRSIVPGDFYVVSPLTPNPYAVKKKTTKKGTKEGTI